MSIVPATESVAHVNEAECLSTRERGLLLASVGTDYEIIKASVDVDRTSKLLAPTMRLNARDPQELYSVASHPDGQTITTAGMAGNLEIFNCYGMCDRLATLNVSKKPINDVHYVNGTLLVAGGQDGRMTLWDVIKGERVRTYGKDGDRKPMTSCPPSADCNLVASGTSAGLLTVWDLRTNEEAQTVKLGGSTGANTSIESLCWDKDASRIFGGTNRSSIFLYDLKRGARGSPITEFGRQHENKVVEKKPVGLNLKREVKTASDGTKSLTLARGLQRGGAAQGSVFPLAEIRGAGQIIEDLPISNTVKTTKNWKECVTGLTLSPCGEYLASMSKEVMIWRASTIPCKSRYICTLPTGPKQNFEEMRLRMAWRDDKRHLAVASSDRNVYVYGDMDRIRSLALLTDESIVDMGPYGNRTAPIHIPDGMVIERTPQVAHILSGHAGAVTDVAWHKKEPILISVATDGSIILGEMKL